MSASSLTDRIRRATSRPGRSIREDTRGIIQELQLIGGGMIMLLIMTLVIVEVQGAVNVTAGPFTGIVNTLEGTGVAAFTLLVVGLLVIAASALLRYFGGGNFGGGR